MSEPKAVQAWHHRPSHLFIPNQTYMITGATHEKQHHFKGHDRLTLLQSAIFEVIEAYDWKLEAWAIFSTHYHLIVTSPERASSLKPMIQRLHSQTARQLNKTDNSPGRKIWFQYWDTCLTYREGYLARLNYVHTNAVRHKLVDVAEDYPYCSAAWFDKFGEEGFKRTVRSFKVDGVHVPDDFGILDLAGSLTFSK